MKIIQRFPFDFFAKIELLAENEGVRWRYKSLISEINLHFSYNQINPKPDCGRYGERGSGSASLFFLVLYVVTVFSPAADVVLMGINLSTVLLCLTAAVFLLQFRKKEFIYYSDLSGKPAFYFCSDKNPKMVDFINMKISEAKENGGEAK